MILCLDVGNTHLCGGVFTNELLFQFRYDSRQIGSSDQFGIFIRNILHENNLSYKQITRIGIASVVPGVDYSIRSACIKYLNLEPLFLQAGIKTTLQIKTHNPSEVGSDLIAAAMAAKNLYPQKDILIFDLGTASTCSFITQNGEFVGASIAPGFSLMISALQTGTAKLFGVDIAIPENAIAKNTKHAIQSGIYYTQLGLIEQLITKTCQEFKLIQKPLIIGTGGFSQLFNKQKIFDSIIPELVLLGIKYMLEIN